MDIDQTIEKFFDDLHDLIDRLSGAADYVILGSRIHATGIAAMAYTRGLPIHDEHGQPLSMQALAKRNASYAAEYILAFYGADTLAKLVAWGEQFRRAQSEDAPATDGESEASP